MFTRYIENFLTPDECKSLIKLGESIGLIQMESSHVINGKVMTENVAYGGNKRMGTYFNNETLDIPVLKSLTNKIIILSNELKIYNGIVYNRIHSYSFNRYGEGDFLDWHSDSHEIINGATITHIIQLNDQYEDGDVKYIVNETEYSVPKKEGSLFILDSNIVHSVKEIKSGVRYSINVWPSKTIKKSLI